MWLYAIYCVGAFNACQGYYRTEANPQFGYRASETKQECADTAMKSVQVERFQNPGRDIRWKCIDISKVDAPEDTRK
jgi:hypothetical protein